MRIQIWPSPEAPREDPDKTPHKWFTWSPIWIDKYFWDEKTGSCYGWRKQIVWLETVERVWAGSDDYGWNWEYKLLDKE